VNTSSKDTAAASMGEGVCYLKTPSGVPDEGKHSLQARSPKSKFRNSVVGYNLDRWLASLGHSFHLWFGP
jgi:hypothetical protein